jgi:hypothetical protein
MFRVLTILAAVAALAVSAAPASAHWYELEDVIVTEVIAKPKPRGVFGLAPNGGLAHRDRSKKPPPSSVLHGEGPVGEMEVVNQRKLGADKDRGRVKALPKPRREDGGNFGDTPGLGGGDMSVRRPATQKTKASGLKAGITDGTSNTMMRSGSLKPSRNGIIAILIG